MKKKLLVSSIQTPDGTVLHSKHKYDYVLHKDKNGETYFLDGGTTIVRTSLNKNKAKDISIYDTDKIEKIRETFSWGSKGKSGLENIDYIKLKDMTNVHIHSVLDTQLKISNELRSVFQRELEFRKKNIIVIYEDNTLYKIDNRLKHLESLGISISISYGRGVYFTLKDVRVFTMTCSDKDDFNQILYSATKSLIQMIHFDKDVIKMNKKGKITKIEDYGKEKYKK